MMKRKREGRGSARDDDSRRDARAVGGQSRRYSFTAHCESKRQEKGQPSSNTVGDLIVVHRLAYSVVGMWQAEASRRLNRR